MGNSSRKSKARGATSNDVDISALAAVKRSSTPELSNQITRSASGASPLSQSASNGSNSAVSQKPRGTGPPTHRKPKTIMRSMDNVSDEEKDAFHTSIKDNDSMFETDDSFDDSEILALELSNNKQRTTAKPAS